VYLRKDFENTNRALTGLSHEVDLAFDDVWLVYDFILQKMYFSLLISVVDPYSFFPDPDPDPEFDVGDQYGSGSGSGSNTDPGL
jgi:hypothetical protein